MNYFYCGFYLLNHLINGELLDDERFLDLDQDSRFQLLGGDVSFPEGGKTTSLYKADLDHHGLMWFKMSVGEKCSIFGFTTSIWQGGKKSQGYDLPCEESNKLLDPL